MIRRQLSSSQLTTTSTEILSPLSVNVHCSQSSRRWQTSSISSSWRKHQVKISSALKSSSTVPVADVPWLCDKGFKTYFDDAEKSMGRKELWSHRRNGDIPSMSSSSSDTSQLSSATSIRHRGSGGNTNSGAAGTSYSIDEQRRLVAVYSRYIIDLMQMHETFRLKDQKERRKTIRCSTLASKLIVSAQENPVETCAFIKQYVARGQEQHEKLQQKHQDKIKGKSTTRPTADDDDDSENEANSDDYQSEGRGGKFKSNDEDTTKEIRRLHGLVESSVESINDVAGALDPNLEEMPFLRMRLAENPDQLGESLREQSTLAFGENPTEGLSEPFYRGEKKQQPGEEEGEADVMTIPASSEIHPKDDDDHDGCNRGRRDETIEERASSLLGNKNNSITKSRQAAAKMYEAKNRQRKVDLQMQKERLSLSLKDTLKQLQPSWDREGVLYWTEDSMRKEKLRTGGGSTGRGLPPAQNRKKKETKSSMDDNDGIFSLSSSSPSGKKAMPARRSTLADRIPDPELDEFLGSQGSSSAAYPQSQFVKIDVKTEHRARGFNSKSTTTGSSGVGRKGGNSTATTPSGHHPAKAYGAREKIERLRRGEDPAGIYDL